MRIFAGIFAFYFFALCETPCAIQVLINQEETCCQDECIPGDKEMPLQKCDDCNPLSGCQCCGSFISNLSVFTFVGSNLVKPYTTSYLAETPSPVIFSIWQPPKTA